MPDREGQERSPDRIGPLRRSFQVPQLEPAWTLLERLDPRPRERLMVVPARNGDLVASICAFHREGRITGVEENPRLAVECRRRLADQEKGDTRVEILEAPYRAVPEPGAHDALICHCHMPVIREPGGFLGALGSNLRPGGRFCLQLPLSPFCQVLEEALYAALDRSAALPAKDDLCPPADPQEIRKLLGEQGFREVEMEDLIFLQAFDSVMGAADTLLAGGGWTGMEEMDSGEQEELLTEIRLRLARALKTDGPVELPFLRLLVWGRR